MQTCNPPDSVLYRNFELSQLTAAVLAGGAGTRLRPLVSDRPKSLALVSGRPFLSFLLERIASAGIRHVVICTGYRGEMIQKTYGHTFQSMSVCYSHEHPPLGTAGALRLALPLYRSDPVMVFNGDSYCEVDLKDLCEYHQKKKSEGTVVTTLARNSRRYGCVETDPENRVTKFLEKQIRHHGIQINAGIYLLNKGLLASIPNAGCVSLEREMFPQWLRGRLYAFPVAHKLIDIGTPASYRAAQRWFAKRT